MTSNPGTPIKVWRKVQPMPNPGSPDAVRLGCLCPQMGNGHGRGYCGMPGVFVRVVGCPLHTRAEDEPSGEKDRGAE